ncbi:hypothetical protein D3C81_836890 [compost metagenome]
MFLFECRAGSGDREVGIALEDAFLLAIRQKARSRDPCRHTGIAVLAVRAIQVIAAAPKAHFRQVCVDIYIHRLARVEKQRGGLLVWQVAAGMGLSGIKLQPRQLCHDQPLGRCFRIKCKPAGKTRLANPAGAVGLLDITLQVVGKACARNGSGTEAVQVIGRHLAVNQDKTGLLQVLDQGDEADL